MKKLISGKERAKNVELYCYSVLECLIPDFPKDMKKSESPDFISKDIGLEITKAQNEVEGQITGVFRDYSNKKYSDIPSTRLSNIGFTSKPMPLYDGGKVKVQNLNEEYFLDYYENEDKDLYLKSYEKTIDNDKDIVFICLAIKNKLNKLDKYTLRSSNRLLINVDSYDDYNESYVDSYNFDRKLLNNIKEIYREYDGKKFDILYILFNGNLIEIKTDTWNFKNIRINNNKFNEIEDVYLLNKNLYSNL